MTAQKSNKPPKPTKSDKPRLPDKETKELLGMPKEEARRSKQDKTNPQSDKSGR